MNYSSGNAIVDAMAHISFQGDVIPHAWYQNIKLGAKPDVVAICILGRIVYWYRPTTVFEESTGALVGVKKRFNADLLQQSYDAFSAYFGFSKKQVREATDRLEDAGLIKKHFRKITSKTGVTLNNVLFIEVFPDAVARVSAITPNDLQGNTLLPHRAIGSLPTGQHPITPQGNTNTENTTKNTSKITTKKKAIFSEKRNSKAVSHDSKSNLDLSDKQIDYFANLLASDPMFGSTHAVMGESGKEFAARIKKLMKNPSWVAEHMDDLKAVGFGGVV